MDFLLPVLVVVLMILAAYYATRWIAKKQNTFTSGRVIKVLERVMLGKDVYLAIVKIDTQLYLMSVSTGKTELLTELSPDILSKINASEHSNDFLGILMSFLGSKNNKNNKDDKNNPKGQDKKGG